MYILHVSALLEPITLLYTIQERESYMKHDIRTIWNIGTRETIGSSEKWDFDNLYRVKMYNPWMERGTKLGIGEVCYDFFEVVGHGAVACHEKEQNAEKQRESMTQRY